MNCVKTRLYIYFRNMAREISLICDFIFGSIWTGLPTDTIDVELMIRMVKRYIHIENIIRSNPWCFCHGVGPLSLFSHCIKRYKHIKMRIKRYQHGIKDTLHPIFLPTPSPNIDAPQERPELDGPTGDIGLNL